MNKRFLKTLVLGAMTFGAAASFVGCKDYDKDIEGINKRIDNLGTDSQKAKAELQKALEDLKAAGEATKASLEAAKKNAEEAVAAAAKAGNDALAAAAKAQGAADGANAAAGKAQGAADAAKTAADAAKTAAEEALKKANEALAELKKLAASGANAGVDVTALQREIKRISDDLKTKASQEVVNLLLEAVDEMSTDLYFKFDKRLRDLKAEVEGVIARIDAAKEITDSLQNDITAIKAQVTAFVGSRLTSIALVPDFHVNGIAAIRLRTLQYEEQGFKKHNKYGYTTSGSSIRTLPSEGTDVRFHLSPSHLGKDDLGTPYFNAYVSENVHDLRAVNAANAGVNKPIRPVEGQQLKIENGILTLMVERSVDDNVNRDILNQNTKATDGFVHEKFYQASLSIPVAQKHLTKDEKSAVITSEIYRIAETIDRPRIKNINKTLEAVVSYNPATGKEDAAVMHYRPYALDENSRPVHYSDSTLLYESAENALIDWNVDWKAGANLLDSVAVCLENNHNTMSREEYAKHGLALRFYFAKGEYNHGANKTDQQKFGVVTPSGMLESGLTYKTAAQKDYDKKPTKTVVGREPIVRIELVDTINNKLVDQRYAKIKWIEDLSDRQLPEHRFTEGQLLSCDNAKFEFLTEPMNVKIYREVEEKFGMSKKQFHAVYQQMEIEHLVKGASDYLIKDKKVVKPVGLTHNVIKDGVSDVQFYYRKDLNNNESYNIVWEMSPKAIGTIVPKKSEEYKISILFKDPSGAWGDLRMDFIGIINVPTQEFAYQGTYWKDGKGEGVFNVNPLVYEPNQNNPRFHGYPNATLNGRSHIEADLVNGYIYKKTTQKPENVDQFIRHIKGCADVRFVFDATRFHKYAHLKGYKVDDTKTSLWKTTSQPIGAVATDAQGNYNYIQANTNLAATIKNRFGATAAENDKATNLDWKEAIALGSGNDEASALIRLHEDSDLDGTMAAKELVGKNVPVNLEVVYNEYNAMPVQQFEVHFIEPLTINGAISGEFEDAVVGGSFINVDTGFGFTDWNKYAVAKQTVGMDEKAKYAAQLYQYYVVREVMFDTKDVKTSLTLQGNTYIHKDGVKNGLLPTNRSLEQTIVTDPSNPQMTYSIVQNNPTHLAYFNNDGTPVNVNYFMYVNASVNYKWGVMKKNGLEVKVNKAGGTPSKPVTLRK